MATSYVSVFLPAVQQLALAPLLGPYPQAYTASQLRSLRRAPADLITGRITSFMVTDPGLIVIIEDPEALAAAVAAVAVAGSSADVRLVLRDEVPLAEAEVAQTALPWIVTWVNAVLALPARAVAKCHRAGRQQARHAPDADAAATTQIAIDSGRKETRRRRRRRRSRSQRRRCWSPRRRWWWWATSRRW